MAKRVKVLRAGYAPRQLGGTPERLKPGEIIEVDDKATAKWWEEMGRKPGRPPRDRDDEA